MANPNFITDIERLKIELDAERHWDRVHAPRYYRRHPFAWLSKQVRDLRFELADAWARFAGR